MVRPPTNDFNFAEGFIDLGRSKLSATSFFDMRQMLNGKLVLVSPVDGSLCIFSPDFNLVEKIDCKQFTPVDRRFEDHTSFTSFGHDPNIVLWNGGGNQFSIVDLETSQLEEISINIDSHAQVFGGLSVFSGRKVALLWTLSNNYGVAYWERSNQKPLTTGWQTMADLDSRRSLSSLDTDLVAIEASVKGELLLVGGNANNKGIVSVTSFDGYFDLVDKLVFEDELVNIKRLLNSDFLILGFKNNFTILELRETILYPLCKFSDQALENITHLAFSDNNLVILHHGGSRLSHIQFNSLNLDEL